MSNRERYDKLMAKSPETTPKDAAAKLNVSLSTIYAYQKKVSKKARRTTQVPTKDTKIKHQKIKLKDPISATGTDGKLIVLMGSPDQIREVLQ